MYLLKLFHDSDPVQPIDAHMVGDGTTIVGRDPTADWVICDPDCEVSRKHCAVNVAQDRISVRSMGTNGVFRADGEERLPDDEDVSLALGDSFSFGKFRIVVDRVPFSEKSSSAGSHTMVMAAPFGESAEVPSEWADADGNGFAAGDGSLLEAFCEGAGLDASAFSAEEPTEIMRRAGAIYRQMVLGLGDLMSERSSVKTHYRMDRTTIGAQDNNPFKWAPTQRLAVDLLMRREGGFLSGPAALKASFEDVKRHLLCTLAGFRASLLAIVEEGRPSRIGKQVEGQSRFLKSQATACWEAYEEIHAKLEEQLSKDRDGPINQAFINAYEERMAELEKGDGPR